MYRLSDVITDGDIEQAANTLGEALYENVAHGLMSEDEAEVLNGMLMNISHRIRKVRWPPEGGDSRDDL